MVFLYQVSTFGSPGHVPWLQVFLSRCVVCVCLGVVSPCGLCVHVWLDVCSVVFPCVVWCVCVSVCGVVFVHVWCGVSVCVLACLVWCVHVLCVCV